MSSFPPSCGRTNKAACDQVDGFVTDLGTVVALGLIFAPFTWKTLVFVGAGALAFVVLPWLTPRFFKRYGNCPSELEAKFLLFFLFGLGALATWADSEAVLPAYLIGRCWLARWARTIRWCGGCARSPSGC